MRQVSSVAPSVPTPAIVSNVRTCEEPEVGDIGGFGSAEKFEAHERRCGQEATEICRACARNLCRNHYELIHRDHDAAGALTAGTV